MEDYTKEQLWEIYKKTPEELKEAVFSEKTSKEIESVCEKNGIAVEKIPDISKYTVHVLLGVLSAEEFQKKLEKDVFLEKETAENVTREIGRSVFSLIKDNLDVAEGEAPTSPSDSSAIPPLDELIKPSQREETDGDDTYRETVE